MSSQDVWYVLCVVTMATIHVTESHQYQLNIHYNKMASIVLRLKFISVVSKSHDEKKKEFLSIFWIKSIRKYMEKVMGNYLKEGFIKSCYFHDI